MPINLANIPYFFLRSLIIQMSGVENAANDSMIEMEKVMESDAFKMQQAKTSMKNALTEMGGLINQMIVDHILPLLQHWINAFKSMPDGVKKLIVVLGALVAAFGPILYMLAIMKMAFGQTMQIMAGAVGKFFTGFTAAGRAATIAANEEAIAVAVLSAAHELQTVKAIEASIAEGKLAATTAAGAKIGLDAAAASAVHAASHKLDAAAALQAASAHRGNMLTNMIRSPLGAGGTAMYQSIKAGRIGGAARGLGRGAKGAAGMAMHPLRSARRGAFAVERLMHTARGGPMGWGTKFGTAAGSLTQRGGGAGAAIARARGQFGAGRAARATFRRVPGWHAGQTLRPATTIPGAMGAGQIKRGAQMVGAKAMVPLSAGLTKAKKAAGTFSKSLKNIGPTLGKLMRPVKMLRMIFMSFNPWVLGFMLLLGAVAAIWITIKNNFETFKAAAEPGLDALKKAWLAIKAALGEVMRAIFQVFNRLSFGGKKGADEGTQMGNVFKVVFQGIALWLQFVAKLFGLLATIISTAMDFATPYINVLLGALTGVIEIVKAIIAVVKGDFSGAWMHAKRAIGAILLGFVSMVDGVFNFIINQMVRLMDIAAGILGTLGKIPGLGWVDTIAEKIKDAGDVMKDFGTHALDGVRDTIASGTGIDPEELIRIGDSDARDIGSELGKVLGVGTVDGFSDALDYTDPGMFDAVNDQAKDIEEAAGIFADAFTSAFGKFAAEMKKQIRKHMTAAIKFIKDAFDAQTESVTSAYDAQIDAINEVIKEEQRLSKEIAYQTKRREQIRDMALRRDSYRRNRALAIYEGRIDDARSLDLKERKSKEDADEKLTDLDTKHGETLLSQQRKDTMDQISEQKRAYKDLRSDMKDELDGVLEELTRFTPKNQAEWMQIVDDIDAEVTKIVGSEEAPGIMGRFGANYHPDMGDFLTFDYAGGFSEAISLATAQLREVYQWTPGAMDVDGPFDWLFTAFAVVEEEFIAFETKIKTWKDRIKAAMLEPDRPYAGGESPFLDPGRLGRYQNAGAGPLQQATTQYMPLRRHTRFGGQQLAEGDALSDSERDREDSFILTQLAQEAAIAAVKAVATEYAETSGWSDEFRARMAGVESWRSYADVGSTIPNLSPYQFDHYGDPERGGGTGVSRGDVGGGGLSPAAVTAGLGLDKVKEPLKARVIRMAMGAARDGIQMTVSGKGGYRNPADQIALFRQRYSRQGPNYRGGGEGDKYWDGSWWKHISGAEVGAPGRSLHERGEAVDISGPSGRKAQRWAWMKDNAKDFDLWAPIAKEPWHHAREGIRNVWSLATGGLVGGLHNQSKMAMLHGGEFVMSAKATQRIGLGSLSNMNSFSKFGGPNDAGGGVTNNSSSNITIQVDTFIGQREWFEKLMSDYNIHIAPSSERARGIEKRTVGSYTERNTRSRV